MQVRHLYTYSSDRQHVGQLVHLLHCGPADAHVTSISRYLPTHSYKKGELEGNNVSILMPQPFSGRHDSYLANYVASGGSRASAGWSMLFYYHGSKDGRYG